MNGKTLLIFCRVWQKGPELDVTENEFRSACQTFNSVESLAGPTRSAQPIVENGNSSTASNDYSAIIAELKESVFRRIRGKDFKFRFTVLREGKDEIFTRPKKPSAVGKRPRALTKGADNTAIFLQRIFKDHNGGERHRVNASVEGGN